MGLHHEHNQHSEESLNQSASTEVREYNSVEALLREDAADNPPPALLEEKVAAATAIQTGSPENAAKPWWKKLLGD